MLIGYFIGATGYLGFLIVNLLRDSTTANSDFTSWQVIAIACLLWPIVLPISYWELQTKAKIEAEAEVFQENNQNIIISNTSQTQF